ncbi:hypothetical protein ACMT1E_14180 [Sphingomonas flavalba]|uniref:hypothetical protein n=1 Tax=Sphingomonas flavalba TaxID=2559804 RepID=UPI0039DFDAE3
MDLGFARLDRQGAVPRPARDLPVLLAGLASRQMTSPTARAQAALAAPVRVSDPTLDGMVALFGRGVQRVSGSFNPAVAALLTQTTPT